MTKQFTWKHYIVQITKKKIKRMNLRIKPETPNIIHMSIPAQMSYRAAMKIFEQPEFIRWIANYEKKRVENPIQKNNWYEEHIPQKSAYKTYLEKILPDIFEKWQDRIGVNANKVSIKDTRSQWGSCNIRNGNISISVWLGAYPIECIEYVVVHELIHLLEKGHNERFYGYLEEYYPNWKSCKEQLRTDTKEVI